MECEYCFTSKQHGYAHRKKIEEKIDKGYKLKAFIPINKYPTIRELEGGDFVFEELEYPEFYELQRTYSDISDIYDYPHRELIEKMADDGYKLVTFVPTEFFTDTEIKGGDFYFERYLIPNEKYVDKIITKLPGIIEEVKNDCLNKKQQYGSSYSSFWYEIGACLANNYVSYECYIETVDVDASWIEYDLESEIEPYTSDFDDLDAASLWLLASKILKDYSPNHKALRAFHMEDYELDDDQRAAYRCVMEIMVSLIWNIAAEEFNPYREDVYIKEDNNDCWNDEDDEV